jgi:hypothetical protein
MSQQLEGSNPSEAEAEGVLPLSEGDVQRMTIRAKDILAVADGEGWPLNDLARLLAEEALIVLAVVKAERTELERKEAEAAVLRGALINIDALGPVSHSVDGEQWWAIDENHLNRILAPALEGTTAGAALFERMRQLEEEVGRLQRVVIPDITTLLIWLDQHEHMRYQESEVVDYLAIAEEWLAEQHQGTGAAGEGGGVDG